jgi:hypothetical protein
LFVAILLLSAFLSRGVALARFIWILLCVHDTFLYYCIRCLRRSRFATRPFLINRRGRRFGLKQTIRMVDGCLIRESPIGHAIM